MSNPGERLERLIMYAGAVVGLATRLNEHRLIHGCDIGPTNWQPELPEAAPCALASSMYAMLGEAMANLNRGR